MTRTKRTNVRSASRRRISLASPRSPLQLYQTRVNASGDPISAPAPKATADNDPTGIKAYIGLSVAHAIYPQGSGIDPDQDISDDVGLNGTTIATEVNVDAQHSATLHQLTWTSVTSDDVAKLKVVEDLVTLVESHLTDSGSTAS